MASNIQQHHQDPQTRCSMRMKQRQLYLPLPLSSVRGIEDNIVGTSQHRSDAMPHLLAIIIVRPMRLT